MARADGPAPRGGAYTYDWIENLLGLDMHSVDRVLPEFQHPQLGDSARLRREPDELSSGRARARARDWRSADGNWVWTFVLDEHDGRDAPDQPQPLPPADARRRVGMIPMEPASLVMERKMLRGIKQRAERLGAKEPVKGAN